MVLKLLLSTSLAVHLSECINLGGNGLVDEGAKHIAEGIAVSASLTYINLSGNKLTNYGRGGIQAIASAIGVSASLTNINLRDN